MSTNYLLRPYDKLFVKDGRPLSLEDDTAASGLFPPPPSVFFGALRSAVLSKADAAPGSDEDPIHTGHILGIAFARNGELLFPAPNDLVREKSKDDKERVEPAYRLTLSNPEDTKLTSQPIPGGHLLETPNKGEIVQSVGGYITANGLRDYLAGNPVPAKELLNADKLYEGVPKLGIGLDYASGTTKDGLLYTMTMQQLSPDVRLCVRAEGFGPLTKDIRLGAEARAAEVKASATDDLTWPTDLPTSGEYLTMYLATPAVFRQGWIPDCIDPKTMEGKIGGNSVRLVAASVGKTIPLGGWDIAKGCPKPMRRAVPAGSVYHFFIQPDYNTQSLRSHYLSSRYDAEDSSTSPDNSKLSYQQQGYGLAYFGQGPALTQAF
jgi:CRISPR-associated protein Cmr3